MGRVRHFGTRSQGAIRIGGANPADTETITIGNKVFEWDNNAAVTAGRVLVTIGGSVAASITNLIAAINANKPTPGVTAFADPIDALVVRLEADAPGPLGNHALAETMGDAANIVSAAAMTGGENGGTQSIHRGEYTVTAMDVTAGSVLISTGLTSPRFLQVDVFDSNGVQKGALTTRWSINGTRILGDADGATNMVAGDRVEWQVYE